MSDFIRVVNMIPNNSSGETNQDSEPNLAVNPANAQEIAGTAFTPSPNLGSPNSPIFYSSDGGDTWVLKDFIAGTPVRDQTLRFATTSGNLYAGVLWGPGGIASINFDILRSTNPSGSTLMTQLATRKDDDQPFIQAATVPSGPDAGKDRIYVGSNDHAPANVPSTMDQSLDAASAAHPMQTFRLEGRTVVRDGFQTRPAVHPNGTIYAVFYALITGSSNCDVVIVRDDNWASGLTPYNALVDPGDTKQGQRIVTAVNNPFLGLNIGQQRIGGDLSVAVHPHDSAIVYVCWGDMQAGTYTLHVRKSINSGASWSPSDLRTITNATNPALAISSEGTLGLLYQQVTGNAPSQRWVTTLEHTHSDFASLTTHFLADTPTATPGKTFDPYLGDYLYMMAVGKSFYGIFCANNTPDHTNFPNGVIFQRNANFTTHTLLNLDNVTPVPVSIDPFFFKIVVKPGSVATGIADNGNFGNVCHGSFHDELLTINNNGSGTLHIFNITSSSVEFEVPSVLSYPLKVEAGDSIDLVLRFQPTTLGPVSATITIFSDDPKGPHKIVVRGDGVAPRLSLYLADTGRFGKVCVGSFKDESLILNNSGRCTLTVNAIHSSAADFIAPNVLTFPLAIAAGSFLPVPIRFEPTSFGPKSATITVLSNDPAGPGTIQVSGDVPSGKLAITGSTVFGGVQCCRREQRVLSLCNTGECNLHVTHVGFKRKRRHFRLINNPFPAVLRPGSCLNLVVQYVAKERVSRSCELVIHCDDPHEPIRHLDVIAYTIWDCCACGCKACKENCDCCKPRHEECCDDDDDDDEDDDRHPDRDEDDDD